jgi:RNA 3'-terminal phosphate cyclase (ATP)
VTELLTIDGSQGEGGGQILRTALALALCLGRAVRLIRIRAARPRPGLRPQHLAAINAAAALSGARVECAEMSSRELMFAPGPVRPGEYFFDIGTAGSTILVLQTLLPALATSDRPSRLILEGGTHNPLAPSFDFFERTFLPLLRRMGARVKARLVRPGFYPAGGGRLEVGIEPVVSLAPLFLERRGSLLGIRARVLISRLPQHIADRELAVLGHALDPSPDASWVDIVTGSRGPGNVVMVEAQSEELTEIFTGCGQRGVPAEQVAAAVAAEVSRYLNAGVPVGEHLADQLLLPLALAGSGSMRTLRPSQHTLTNIAVIESFLPVRFRCEQITDDDWRITAS